MPLTNEERQELIGRARRAGAEAVGSRPSEPPFPAPAGRLAEPGAAFVTWKREGRLRGCIGSVKAWRPLAVDVESNAVSALIHDPRFAPTTVRDFPRLAVELSVLSELEEIRGSAEIEIGLHGIYIQKGSRAGLLLPQVATEWGYDREKFLEQVCLKAGLPGDAWRSGSPPATLYRFVAEIFGDESA